MWIESLTLQDFRNYEKQTVSFSPGMNLILGDNGEGKTNLLEAVYLLSTTRSHRTGQDRDLVRFGEKFYYTACKIRTNRGMEKVELGYSLDRKQKVARLSGVPLARLTDMVGVLNAVLFSPEDMDLVKGSPARRRRFLDILISQLRRGYVQDLQKFNRLLSQRNDCLRHVQSRRFPRDVLCTWDEQYVEAALAVSRGRRRVLDELCPMFESYASRISGKEILTICYNEVLKDMDAEELSRRMGAGQDADIMRGSTRLGPHRDDIEFLINGRPASLYASQGQQRTAVLALKLTELSFLKEKNGETPVLLLDDVFSELDESRKRALIAVLDEGVQSLITGTREGELTGLRARVSLSREFQVRKGRVT